MKLSNARKLKDSIKYYNRIQDKEHFLTIFDRGYWLISDQVQRSGKYWLNITKDSFEDIMFMIENNMVRPC